MANETFIPIHTNGGSIEQTPNMKLSDNLGTWINDRLNIVPTTGDANAVSGQRIKSTTSGALATISLPVFVSGITKEVWVMKMDISYNTDIDCVDGKNIDGAAKQTFTTLRESACFIQDPVSGDWDMW